MHKKILLFIAIFFGILCSVSFSSAGSYDLYVDKDCQSTQDGSSEKPYCTISEALENASSKKNKIYIKSGTYKEKIVLEKNIEIYGKDTSSVVIENPATSGSTIIGKGFNTIENITVKGGYNGITFEKEGSVEKCIIKNVTKNAIDLSPNDGKVEVIKNKIFNNAKGIYVEANRSVNISGNEIRENSEEGIDLRENIKGFIQNNIITKNGEGGIELVIGSTDLIISGNTITKNGASGIAAQFYSFISKIGEVTISDNIVSENKHFGLTCKNTQGGDYSKDYWDKSIELSNNAMENNKMKTIDPTCSIVRAIDKEEEAEATAQVEDDKKETEEDKKQDMQEQQEIIILDELERIEFNLKNFDDTSENLSKEIENRGKIKLFFFGFDRKKINELTKLNSQQEKNKKRLEELKAQTQKDLVKERIDADINKIAYTLIENQQIILKGSEQKGVWNWFKGLF